MPRAADTPLEDVPYHFTYKCDNCTFNRLCLRDTAERTLTDWVVEQRAALMAAGVLMFLAHPVLGVGPGGFAVELTSFGAQVPELWDYLADWYVKETGLQNSIGLVPMDDLQSPYAIVNWSSWDDSLLNHFARSVGKPSFWRHVKANLDANMAASMPVYCRLA